MKWNVFGDENILSYSRIALNFKLNLAYGHEFKF